jgi:hypothetical protein
MNSALDKSQERSQGKGLALGATTLSQGDPSQLVQPSPVSGIQPNALSSNGNQCKTLIALFLL